MRITKGYNPNTQLFTGNCSSVGNLNPVINVNGLDGTTVFRYNGKYANISYMRPWGYGEVLPIASSGTDPTFGAGSPLLGSVDDSIKFNAGDVFQAANATLANITTEDFYIEGFFKTPSAYANEVVFSKYDGSTAGYMLLLTSSGYIRFYVDGTQSLYYGYNTQYQLNTWYYFSIFYDVSETSQANGMQIYINNLNNTAYQNAYTPNDIGNITNTNVFSIGTRSDITQKFNGNFSFLLMAKRSSWFAGGAQNLVDWAALHKERFSQISGIYPQIADNDAVYTSYTRSSPAFLRKTDDDGYVSYHQMGDGWPRIEKNKDDNGNIITGLLEEASDTEYFRRSTDISNWSFSRCTTPSSITGPLGLPAWAAQDTTVEPAALKRLGYVVGIQDPGGATLQSVRVIIAKETFRYFNIVITTDVGAIITQIKCDLDTGAMTNFDATKCTYVSSASKNLGTHSGKNFWWFELKYTENKTYAGNILRYSFVAFINNSGDTTYVGAEDIGYYVAHMSWRYGTNLITWSSPIITTTATVTRAADSTIPFTYSNTLTQGSKSFNFYKQFPPSANTNIFSITDGTSNNMIYAYVDTNGYLNAEVILSSVSQGTAQIATDICDGEKKKIGVRWNSTNLDILIYDYHTQTIEIDTNSVLDIPLNLTTNNFLVGDFIISNSKDYEYYEYNNNKLLFA